MNRSVSATALLLNAVALVLAVLVVTPGADAVDTGQHPPQKEVLDCSLLVNLVCRECCDGGLECPGAEEPRLFCCQTACEIKNRPPQAQTQSFPDILLDVSAGGARLMFERAGRVDGNGGQRHVEITLQQIFLPLLPRSGFTVKAGLTGEGAAVGSLLYAVAFLGMGEDALGALQVIGYNDVSLVGAPPTETCQSRFDDTTCAALANQLGQGISASLAIGTAGERGPFLQGLQALGLGLCQVVPE